MAAMTISEFKKRIKLEGWQLVVLLEMLDYYDSEACSVLAGKIRAWWNEP